VNDVHGKAVDIWALGITLYCMLTGRLPWTVDNPLQIVDVVRSKECVLEADVADPGGRRSRSTGTGDC
jgi:[calcium/calmodulin-dependent protein kinase] kinase